MLDRRHRGRHVRVHEHPRRAPQSNADGTRSAFRHLDARIAGRMDELPADPRYASNSKRSAARDELRQMIIEVFEKLTAAEVVQRLDDAHIANARVNDMHDVWDHPQLRARKRWRDVTSPAGTIPALLPPGSSDGGDEASARMDPVPALGEHTDAILAELGCSAADIADLRAASAI